MFAKKNKQKESFSKRKIFAEKFLRLKNLILLIYNEDKLKLLKVYNKNNIFPFQKLYVPPQNILISNNKINRKKDNLKNKFLANGSWDKDLVDLKSHPAINASYLVSKFNLKWSDLGEEERLFSLIEKYKEFDNCKNKKEIKQRLYLLSKYLEKMKLEKDRSSHSHNPFSFLSLTGPQVAISRDGRIVKVGDGQHRIGFALGLSMPYMEVSLRACHPIFLNNLEDKNLRKYSIFRNHPER